MPDTRNAVIIRQDTGEYWWQANVGTSLPLKSMDNDYLANVARLIHRRREELKEYALGCAMRQSGRGESTLRPDTIDKMIDEDGTFLDIIFEEFSNREEFEDD